MSIVTRFYVSKAPHESHFYAIDAETYNLTKYHIRSLKPFREKELDSLKDLTIGCCKHELVELLQLRTDEELFRRRVQIFRNKKEKYGLNNKDLYALTGITSNRWDEFDNSRKDLNKNVYYAFCFFLNCHGMKRAVLWITVKSHSVMILLRIISSGCI